MAVDRKVVDAFKKNGATILRGVFSDFLIEELRVGLDFNMATPGPYNKNYTKEGQQGFFSVTTVTGNEYNNTSLFFLSLQQLR